MSKSDVPIKAIFMVGMILGAGIVAAVTFSPGDAGTVSDGVPYGADGMNATIEGETDVIMESDVLYPDSSTVDIKSEAGNISFSSSGPAWASVSTSNITGTYTNLTNIDAQNDITADPEDKQQIIVGGNIDHVAWKDTGGIATDDNTIDFVYGGASGTSKITIGGVSSNTQIAAIDADTNAVLDVATSDGSGTITFDSLDNSDHAVTLQTSSGGPSLDDSSMSPTGDNLRYEDQTLSIDLSDPDLPDDEITLEWYVDGTKQDTTTVTSGGTKTVTVGPLADGNHDWYVVATDAYGQSDTSATKTFEIDHHDPQASDIKPSDILNAEPSQISATINDTDFAKDGDSLSVDIILDGSTIDTQTVNSNQSISTSMPSSGKTGGSHDIQIDISDSYGQSASFTESYQVPDTFYIRNETNHSQLVPADGEVRFYAENNDTVYSRTAPGGTLDLDGLPVNQDFIVEIQPTEDNYTTRTVYIESIFEQQSAYVLNTSAYSTIESRFRLEDPTGQYDSETLLKIQKPIEINGNTRYQTIVADRFGVEGVTATLEEGQRYSLAVSSDSDSQTVGPYRAAVSETVDVQPGTSEILQDVGEEAYKNGWYKESVLKNTTLEYAYSDLEEETDKLVIYIHERGNESNQLTANQTYLDIGNATGQVSLSVNESKKEWVVKYVVTRNGETYVLRDQLANTKDLTLPIDSGWQLTFGIALLILFAGAFSVLNARIGAVIVSLVGGLLWWIGFLGTATTGIAVAVAIFLSILAYMYRT